MSIWFWLGKPEELPDDFHKPFILSAVRIWNYMEGFFWGMGWAFVIFRHTGLFLALGLTMVFLSFVCDAREKRWTATVRKELA